MYLDEECLQISYTSYIDNLPVCGGHCNVEKNKKQDESQYQHDKDPNSVLCFTNTDLRNRILKKTYASDMAGFYL